MNKSGNSSDADWNAYLRFRRQFYVYNPLPIKSFKCKFEVPSFSDTLNKINSGINRGDKYKSKVATTGTLGFLGEFDSFIVFMPGIQVEKAGTWDKLLWGSEDKNTKDINEKIQSEALVIRSYITALMHELIIPRRDKIKVKEVSLSPNESRAVVSAEGIELSSRLKGTTLSYTQTMPNGLKVNATTNYKKVKNGLIPVSSVSAVTNELAMATVNQRYEFQLVDGWQLPKRLLVDTNTQGGSAEIKTTTDIRFSECKIEK